MNDASRAYVCFTEKAKASPEVLEKRRLMVEKGVPCGHAMRHALPPLSVRLNDFFEHWILMQMLFLFYRQVLEAKPAWQPGAMQGKYRIAPPAKLNGYQRSLVG